jgi:pilus assembly protein CpaF
MASAVDAVDGEVRELIRRRGLDPFTDPGAVRLLVRDVVAGPPERFPPSAQGDADPGGRVVPAPEADHDHGSLRLA